MQYPNAKKAKKELDAFNPSSFSYLAKLVHFLEHVQHGLYRNVTEFSCSI